MSRGKLRDAIRNGDGQLPKITDVSSKDFIDALDKCQTPEEIYSLLADNMDSKTLADRVSLLQKNCHNNDLIVALESNKARCNSNLGFRTSHEAKVIMAADRFQKITQGKAGHKVEEFEKGLAKYMASHTQEKSDVKDMALQLVAWRTR